MPEPRVPGERVSVSRVAAAVGSSRGSRSAPGRASLPWVAIVPQKSLAQAKSRLDLPDPARRRVAEAMLRDTVSSLSQVDCLQLVVVAWEDPADRNILPTTQKVLNVVVPFPGLNGAITTVEERLPEWTSGSNRIVFPGDLPGCNRQQVSRLLDLARGSARSFLRDAEGVGTTVLTACGDAPLSPQYGRRSARNHLVSGARPLVPEHFPSLARDVDTLTDLAVALRLGVGPATLVAASDLGLTGLSLRGDGRPHLSGRLGAPGVPGPQDRRGLGEG
jgi:2-phospho-L-lactate guanylyltransferase